MQFFVRCIDKPGHLEVRLANRPAHKAYLESLGKAVVLAGPTLAEDGETMTGTVAVFEQPDRARLDALLAADPYAKAGLFESVEIHLYKKVFG